jgi:hypothetical protein
MGTAKFKKGDMVRVRLDNASPYRGRSGLISQDPLEDSFGVWYMVKFESAGFSRVYRFLENDLDAAFD